MSLRTRTVAWDAVIDMALHKKPGQTRKRIALHVGLSPQALGHLYTGVTAEPVYSVGAELIKMSKQEGEK